MSRGVVSGPVSLKRLGGEERDPRTLYPTTPPTSSPPPAIPAPMRSLRRPRRFFSHAGSEAERCPSDAALMSSGTSSPPKSSCCWLSSSISGYLEPAAGSEQMRERCVRQAQYLLVIVEGRRLLRRPPGGLQGPFELPG